MPNSEKVNQTSPELEKLLKVFNTKNIIGKEEIDQVLGGIVTIIESFQKKNSEVGDEMKNQIAQVLKQMADEHNAVLDQMRQLGEGTRNLTVAEAKTQADTSLKQIKKLISDFKKIKPKDGDPGRNADPEDVVPLVLEKIKLPEHKEKIVTGEEIVDKINELPTDNDEDKIDWKHIKNAPKQGTGGISAVVHPKQIHVSETPPLNPAINDLWVQIT